MRLPALLEAAAPVCTKLLGDAEADADPEAVGAIVDPPTTVWTVAAVV